MLAIEIEYLMGRVLASTHNERRMAEWPPHPQKLFSALVAAYEECDLGSDARAALEWMEALRDPPQIYAQPPDKEGWGRDVSYVFVPVNDSEAQFKKNKIKKKLYPLIADGINLRRNRQPRQFPAFSPSDRHVWFIWKEAPDQDRHKPAIQRIAENVTYLGHPMSPVRMRICDSPPKPTLIPNPNGHIIMRLPGVGRLKHLEEIYKLRLKNESIRASLGREIYYGFLEEIPSRYKSVFSTVYTFKIKIERFLPAQSTMNLTRVVRRSILDLYPRPIPEIISGHDQLGNPSRSPHLAITPLMDVGHQYADGHILGFAVWIPENMPLELTETLNRTFAEINSITLGRFGLGKVEYVTPDEEIRAAKALKTESYIKSKATWASVTPVIFGKYPKRSQVGPGKNGGKVFAELCEMIGLPNPSEVRIGPSSAFRGVPMASEFVPPRKYADRFRAHVWLSFERPVEGPVLLGAGRFNGFGLCKPC